MIDRISSEVSKEYPVPEPLRKITSTLAERGIRIEFGDLCETRSGEPAGKSAIITSLKSPRELKLTNLYAPEWSFENSDLQWWRLPGEKIPGKIGLSDVHKITEEEQTELDTMDPIFTRAIKILISSEKLEIKETQVSRDSRGALNPIAVIVDKGSELPILIIGMGTQSKNEVWTAEKIWNDRTWNVS